MDSGTSCVDSRCRPEPGLAETVDLTRRFRERVFGVRSLPQNSCLHKWCRVITDHINEHAGKVVITEETVKELVLLKLGNTREIMGEKVAMRSSKYRHDDGDLTEAEVKAGHISMSGLLMSMEAWAYTDLNGLKLIS